jgi:hypothetical protein
MQTFCILNKGKIVSDGFPKKAKYRFNRKANLRSPRIVHLESLKKTDNLPIATNSTNYGEQEKKFCVSFHYKDSTEKPVKK